MQPVFLHADYLLPANAADVWAILGDFTHPRVAKGFVSAITGNSCGVGSIRMLEIEEEFGGGQLFEIETARDDKGHYCAYELAGKLELPITDYYGAIHLIEVDAASTRVIWTNRYLAPINLAAELRQRSLRILDIIESNLRAELGATAV